MLVDMQVLKIAVPLMAVSCENFFWKLSGGGDIRFCHSVLQLRVERTVDLAHLAKQGELGQLKRRTLAWRERCVGNGETATT